MMNSNRIVAIAITLTVGLGVSHQAAAVGHATNIASETTQVLNLAQLADQSLKLVKQLKKAKQQLEILEADSKALTDGEWESVLGTLREVEGVYREAQSISFAAKNVTARYEEMYRELDGFRANGVTVEGVHALYQKWGTNARRAVISNVKAAGIISREIRDDAAVIDQVHDQGMGGRGRNEILQAGLTATSVVAQQVLKLRQQLLADAEMERVLKAQSIERKAMIEAESSRVLDTSKLRDVKLHTF